MSEKYDPLGLGSLWDLEEANATLDESREMARNDRARTYFGDALRSRAALTSIDVAVANLDRPIHVSRVGLNWVGGTVCSTTEEAIVPFASLDSVRGASRCACPATPPDVTEFVPLGAVLRRWERRATEVTAVTRRGGLRGRLHGVWRDAVELRTQDGFALVAFEQLELIVVTSDAGA